MSDFDSHAPATAHLEAVALAELAAVSAPGGGVYVIADGHVAFAKAFGADRTGAPFTPETPFPVGSVTKLFTAVALAKFAAETGLDLDAPVGSALPTLHPATGALSARRLLTHTAGLRDFGALPDATAAQTDFAAPPEAWNEDAFFTRPGEIFSYANPGYALVGRLLAADGGYASGVRRRILAPLGLRDTGFVGDAETSDFAPAGLLSSTLHDLGRFAAALLGEELRPPLTRLTEGAAPIPGRDEEYGFGCLIRREHGVEIIEHVGATPDFGCLFRLVPARRFAVIAFAARGGAHLPRTAEAAMEAWLSLPPPTPRRAAERLARLDAEDIARCAGGYANPPRRAEIFAKDGMAFFRRGNFVSPVLKDADRRLFTMLPVGGKSREIVIASGASGAAEYLYAFGSLRALRRTPKSLRENA
jgi:CubicO group peptidase (beta-lactamase class C family)